MQCLQCQHANRDSAKFCEACGARFLQACPHCGHEVRPQARFCDDCGRPLVAPAAARDLAESVSPTITPHEAAPLSYTPSYLAEKILTARHALAGERKQVTVLFADIKDSTELIRDLDPEAAQHLLDPAIHLMMEAVHRFEGTVNQVLGDGIMALFGAPLAHEDHAARACYAALAMQAAMQPYAEAMLRAHGIALRIRVGLNSGEVVVRTIGNDLHMDYSAVGVTTHLAARMEQLAMPGSIMLSSATLQLVEGLVRVDARGPVPVKGLAEPVQVYELTGASPMRRRFQAAAARGLTTFVGRDTEIDTLAHAQQYAEAGQGQVVATVGEAGVGKSRLLYEFVHSYRTQGWLVLESASVSYGKASPYFPVIDLLKRYAHVEEGDEPRTIRAKITGQIMTLDETLQETIPALLSLLDALPDDSPFLQLEPAQRRQRILDGLKRLLLRESQVQPVVLVCEDLHWIDAETQALLDSLITSLPQARLLLLVNYRPEYQHAWGSKTYYTQLRLDPLPPVSAEAFLAALLGSDASLAFLKTLLIQRTEGNPFFLEESVQTLVETGILLGQPGAYRQVQEVPITQVPATVQTLLAARIDRLPLEAKQLLQTAAVIGNDVPLSLLQAITDSSEAVLNHALTHLQAAEFLYETSLFPERLYTFKHALTHDVAYGGLLQERRRLLHAQLVDALATRSGERLVEQVEQLAHHALRGAVWDKALLYCRQAGSKARLRGSEHEAMAYFGQALEALQQMPERRDLLEQAIDLRCEMRPSLLWLGEHKRIDTYLQEAETLAEALDDRPRLGRVYALRCQQANVMGQPRQALAFGHRALELATAQRDPALQIQSRRFLGMSYSHLGDYAQAITLLRQNVIALTGEQRYERPVFQNFMPFVFSASGLSTCLAELGDFSEGKRIGHEALRVAEQAGHVPSQVWALFHMNRLYLYQGDLNTAIALGERALGLLQSIDMPGLFPTVTVDLGGAYALSGRSAEAIALLEEAMRRRAAGGGMASTRTRLALELSVACLHAGRLQDAVSYAQQALDSSLTQEQRGHQAWVLHLLGDIARRREPPDRDQAATHYQAALTLANELGMCPLQAHCHCGFGALYKQTGQTEHARAELAIAMAMYRNMEMTLWLPETEAMLAETEKR